MVAGADFVVDAEAHAHDALAAPELLGILGAHAALARELALAVGDDHLEPCSAVRIASFKVFVILATL